MKNLYLILFLSMYLVSGCSNKKNEPTPNLEGLYELPNTSDTSKTYLRIFSDRAVRYVVEKDKNAYYWEVLSFESDSIIGPLKLTEATCLSPNNDKINQIIEDLSSRKFRYLENGFLLDNTFFKKIDSDEEEKFSSQLSVMNFECPQEEGITLHIPSKKIEGKIQSAPSVLSADLLNTNILPILSGKVLKKINVLEGFEYYVVFSDKAYVSYLYSENDETAINDNFVSWNYGELLDGELTGRTQKLKNSCSPNHPLSHGLGKIKKASKNKIEQSNEADNIIKIGEEAYQVLNTEEWLKAFTKMSIAKIVCNASLEVNR